MMPFDHFDLIAPIFSRVGYSSFGIMQEVAALPVTGRVLDVGGGTGRVAAMLGGLAGEVVVADPSFGMLRQADSARLGLVCANSETLPFPAESFERIIMVDALHHVIHQGTTAQEMIRVLMPGGKIIIEEPDIRNLGVKLVALAEKLLLMRSHFLSPDEIVNLFVFDHVRASIKLSESNAWVIIEKPV